VPPYAETQTYVRAILARLAAAPWRVRRRAASEDHEQDSYRLGLLAALAPPRAHAQAADPAGSSPLLAALNWVQGTLLGNLATTAAVIAVADHRLMMLTGRFDWRRGLRAGRHLHHLRRRIHRGRHPQPGRRALSHEPARLRSRLRGAHPAPDDRRRHLFLCGPEPDRDRRGVPDHPSFWVLASRLVLHASATSAPARAAVLRPLDHQAAHLPAGAELRLLARELVPAMSGTFLTTGAAKVLAPREARSATACPMPATWTT
jgi:hypothetical protein